MKHLLLCATVCAAMFVSCQSSGEKSALPEQVTLSKEVLLDKIKGGWAGQAIGCTYGGPTEFKFQGSLIPEYVKIDWHDSVMTWWYDNSPGLYDDVYMDVTFVKVFDSLGLEAPVDAFAYEFANAPYPLWHANQAARYNLLHGIKAPASGHWKNNYHANDIDFQIEADFAGLMSPGMVNSASVICDSIGHIMNYGDGYYGGVYVAAMYALAFVSDDIEFVVTEALNTIPAESKFHQCISDVLTNYKKYPNDWKQTWFEIEKKWEEHYFCAAFDPYNIEAKLNAAYIVIGLLYGNGDFTQTMDISMRCGQDSDCNPANAAGILGTMFGYSKIPQQYLSALAQVENREVVYTGVSLADIYQMSYQQAEQMIARNGGTVSDDNVTIAVQQPVTVAFEESFPGYYPTKMVRWSKNQEQKVENFAFTGKGIVINGNLNGPWDYVAEIELIVDGKVAEKASLPVNYHDRRYEQLSYTFDLPMGDHVATLKWLNPVKDGSMQIKNVVVYGDVPEAQTK